MGETEVHLISESILEISVWKIWKSQQKVRKTVWNTKGIRSECRTFGGKKAEEKCGWGGEPTTIK